MATDSPQYATLAAGVVTTVTFTANYGRVEVLSDGTADVYFTTDGTAPSADATGSYWLPAGVANSLEIADEGTGTATVVKVKSAGTPKVSVRGK